ncbi:MAG: arsenite methyltransferase [Anaerolineales bacterium]|nr:arsenite methyltransferase [Anaerolineales bacterium]MDW8446600.1 arsenite methyltransferase [Anaerolineales bacterium]
MTSTLSPLHDLIQSYYAKRVEQRESCCSSSSCCASADSLPLSPFESLPAEVQPISFGCGDPLTIADLQEGQVVLDLGSGTGYDCFLAAKRVGDSGKVIGVDMTPQMIQQATQTAQRLGLSNVEFRLGYLEDLPIDSNSVDVIISNCVINLAPDKHRVLCEAYRVLKPGGRLAVTDRVSLRPLPAALREDAEAWAACIAGAITKDEWAQILSAVGFKEIEITLSSSLETQPETVLEKGVRNAKSAREPLHFVVSARITAIKAKS